MAAFRAGLNGLNKLIDKVYNQPPIVTSAAIKVQRWIVVTDAARAIHNKDNVYIGVRQKASCKGCKGSAILHKMLAILLKVTNWWLRVWWLRSFVLSGELWGHR